MVIICLVISRFSSVIDQYIDQVDGCVEMPDWKARHVVLKLHSLSEARRHPPP